MVEGLGGLVGRGRFRAETLTLSSAGIAVLLIGGLPLCYMLLESLNVEGHFSLLPWKNLLASKAAWSALRNSLVLASVVTCLTLIVGVPLGVLLGKTDLPGRQLFSLLFVSPLLLPPYVLAIAWTDSLAPGGLLAGWGVPVDSASRLLFGWPGAVGVLFSVFLPIPMLLTLVSVRRIDPALEEAARLVTAWPGVLRRITLPLALPGILLSAMLVFLLTLGEFSVPLYFRLPVYPVESFTQFSAFHDFGAATVAALPLLAIALLLLAGERLWLRDKTFRMYPAPGFGLKMALGRRSWVVVVIVAALASVIVAAPFLVLLVQSQGAFGEAWMRAGGSLFRSLGYAAVGASLLTILGFLTGYLIRHRALRCWSWIDSLTVLLFTLPATVVGIGLIGLWNRPWTNVVYATPLIVLLGYLAKYLALSSRIAVAQLMTMPDSLEEAAAIAGAGWWRRMLWIVVPLAGRGLAASWLVGYLFSLRDTGITLLVYPPGADTLPVRIFTLMANGSPALIAALCLMLALATWLPGMVLWRIVRRRGVWS